MVVPYRARLILIGTLCMMVGATLVPTLATAAVDNFKDVFVQNTVDDPVPVVPVGTTEVSGSVAISGTPAVTIANAPTVTPVSERLQFVFPSTGSGTFSRAEYDVPAGKRLEIEFVTFHDLNRTQAVTQYEVQVSHGGSTFTHYIASSSQANNGDVVSEKVAIFADPGTTVAFIVVVTPGLIPPPGGFDFMYGSFSGTLTDV